MMIERTHGASRLSFSSLKDLKHVHVIGICGTGMSALAGLFHSCGVKVTGSDQAAYPPTSLMLDALGIHVKIGYKAQNLIPRPDLVVVGNVARRSNPEALEIERLGLPYTSLPESLNQFFLRDKRLIVVAGTHGKTTVSSMVAWIFMKAGFDPSFLIGGVHGNVGSNYRIGYGKYFVLEGDEYDTAYFDKKPKILHYHPYIGVVTSCEFDHADIYENLSQIEEQFSKFWGQISPEGALVACAEYPNLMRRILDFSGRTVTYGTSRDCTWTLIHAKNSGTGLDLCLRKGRTCAVGGTVSFMGMHNGLNALAAVAVADLAGLNPQTSLDALSTYKMPARRQQILVSTSTATVIDDFAHHPTAVGETIKAIRTHWRGRRLIAVFEPRSNSSRTAIFQDAYADCFGDADMAVIKEPEFRNTDPLDSRFSAGRLVSALKARGISGAWFNTSDAILEFVLNNLKPHDVILIMSNGHFDNLASRLVQVLQEEDVERSAALRKN